MKRRRRRQMKYPTLSRVRFTALYPSTDFCESV